MDKLPRRGGISLYQKYWPEILETSPDIGWLQICAEDFFGDGGEPHFYLREIGKKYALALNCLSLSIGSAESTSNIYLDKIKNLLEQYTPAQISTPLCWSRWQGQYLEAALPIPYTYETVDQTCINIKSIQNALGCRILIENPASYIKLNEQELTEGAFFDELIGNTGCGILLDINKLYLSCINLGIDPYKTLDDFPLAAIREIRLSGHEFTTLNENEVVLIEDSLSLPRKPVWQLFRYLVSKMPHPWPTSIDWSGSAALSELMGEMRKLDQAWVSAEKDAVGAGL